MCFVTDNITCKCNALEKCILMIMAGCSNHIRSIQWMLSWQKQSAKEKQSSCRAFMDDPNVMTAKEIGMSWLFRRLNALAT